MALSDEQDDVAVAYLHLKNAVEKSLTKLGALRSDLRTEGLPLFASDVLQVIVTLREALET